MVKELESRGHLYRDQQEEIALANRLRHLVEREVSRVVRIHVIPTYECNLRCVYCYEEGIPRSGGVISRSRLEAMLEVIEHISASATVEKTQLVLFGGEPLLNRPAQVEAVRRVLEYGQERHWELEVVTNGVELRDYVPLLKEYGITQIQVTIDGPKSVHDKRRPRLSGRGSFDAIVRSVSSALSAKLPVVVRVNGDNQNVDYAPELVALFRAYGWLDEPLFGAYWGLTFDLNGRHRYCGPPDVLLKKILEIRKQYPLTKRISLEAWEALQFLLFPFFLGEPRLPKFFFCGAQRNEWCFDLWGNIYYCADSVGRSDFIVGRYIPSLQLDTSASDLWRHTDPLHTPGCAVCPVRLCCGGGCWFRRICAVGSLARVYCTEHVRPVLEVVIEYLHRMPEVFELDIERLHPKRDED
ncbi:radical SAM protein [Candidatus Bipolaricaulota bacterium]|nr:radical SAM protein [Candidatus Bipolaricaulota bacterium]